MHSVILADDEPYILQGLEKKIDWTSMGFQIVAKASNGEECLQLINMHRPDLVITDIRMPGINGLHLLERIRSRNDEILVVFISGYSEFEYARKALELGALSYLLKPIGKQELRHVLEKAFERIEGRRSESRAKMERAADETLEFLANLPPGIDSSIILDKLQLKGRYDSFLCIAEEPRDDGSILQRCSNDHIEITTLRPGTAVWIHILNIPVSEVERLVSEILHLRNDSGCSVGISRSETKLHKISELIRNAKNACFSSFVTGAAGCYRSATSPEPILQMIMNDFEMLFTMGNEGKLHRLMDEFSTMCQAERPSMQEIVAFYNGVMDMSNRYSISRKMPFYADAPVADTEQLYRKFTNIQNMVEHLHDVIHELFESTARGALIRDSSADTVAAIKQYIRKNLDADLSAESLSGIFHAEKSQLAALFRSETGKSLNEFIREARIDHACFLLQHTHMSIQEISDMCGFSDYFYFAKQFKREKGVTATEYRKRRLSQ